METILHPQHIEDSEQLEDVMSAPTPEVVEAMGEMAGDLLILGVGGKMGPTLAKLARRAIDESGSGKRVIGVSRFSSPGLQADLNRAGIETISCDLLNETELQALPEVPNVIFMAGRKFGSTGNEPLTWAMNTYMPGRVAEKYRKLPNRRFFDRKRLSTNTHFTRWRDGDATCGADRRICTVLPWS